MSNVRFYRLTNLPGFESPKHVGIFVHATGTTAGSDTFHMTTGETFNQWLTNNHYDQIPSGLWFGGENGWELLSNDTTSGKIDAAIDAKIATLDAGPYAQATISTTDNQTEKSSTLTIKGIQEVDGKISESTNLNFNVAIDGLYDRENNKIATQSTVNNKIATLDASAFQTVTKSTSGVNTVLTFNGIKEVDGIISQGVTENAETLTVGDAKLKIQIGSNEASAFDVFSANAQTDSTIKLDGYVFKKDENNVISVITPTAVSESNKLVTQQDVAKINGAMFYKGSIASDTNWPTEVKAGDVYIASGNFEHGDGSDAETIESGDLIVFNTDSVDDYTVVQSNITLGTGAGQVAANTEGLIDGNLVVATDKGIKTTGISASVLEEANNTRNLTYSTITGVTSKRGISITDSLKIMNRDFNKTINIVSENDSIQITGEHNEQNDTGVKLDLVWNTQLD